jgi:hypothetical protein
LIDIFINLFGQSDYMLFAVASIALIPFVILLISIFGGYNDLIIFWMIFTIILLLPAALTVYLSQIEPGEYTARIIKKNGMIIGEGTKDAKKFIFKLEQQILYIDYQKYKFDKKKSNIYISYFNNKKTIVTITKMGTVSILDKNHNLLARVKVNY